MTNEAVKKAREDLAKAIAKLRTTDGWQTWLVSKARLYTYSFNNQLMIFAQRPTATIVRGRRQWENDFNRRLRPREDREKPIWILAPRTKKLEETDPLTGKPKVLRYFRNVKVYDVADTEQIPGEPEVPLQPPSQPVTGDSHAGWIFPLRAFANELRYTTQLKDLSDQTADGWCDAEARHIVIDSSLPPNGQVRVLVHEIAHAMGISYSDEGGRPRAEACADAAAFIACHAIGLDVSASSVPYIAGWDEDAEQTIIDDAERIDKIAKRISRCRQAENRGEGPAPQ